MAATLSASIAASARTILGRGGHFGGRRKSDLSFVTSPWACGGVGSRLAEADDENQLRRVSFPA
jgi:hypothetical protein